jgi:hypothetical protein
VKLVAGVAVLMGAGCVHTALPRMPDGTRDTAKVYDLGEQRVVLYATLNAGRGHAHDWYALDWARTCSSLELDVHEMTSPDTKLRIEVFGPGATQRHAAGRHDVKLRVENAVRGRYEVEVTALGTASTRYRFWAIDHATGFECGDLPDAVPRTQE